MQICTAVRVRTSTSPGSLCGACRGSGKTKPGSSGRAAGGSRWYGGCPACSASPAAPRPGSYPSWASRCDPPLHASKADHGLELWGILPQHIPLVSQPLVYQRYPLSHSLLLTLVALALPEQPATELLWCIMHHYGHDILDGAPKQCRALPWCAGAAGGPGGAAAEAGGSVRGGRPAGGGGRRHLRRGQRGVGHGGLHRHLRLPVPHPRRAAAAPATASQRSARAVVRLPAVPFALLPSPHFTSSHLKTDT